MNDISVEDMVLRFDNVYPAKVRVMNEIQPNGEFKQIKVLEMDKDGRAEILKKNGATNTGRVIL